jgi:anti-sigma B factor antagonist
MGGADAGLSPVTPTPSDGRLQPGRSGGGDATVFFDDGVTLVMLSGEIDLALGDDLEYAGRDAIDRGEPVRVDLSRVTFIDSVGLGFVARMASAEREHGRRLALVGPRRSVNEAIHLVGLAHLVDFVESVESGDSPSTTEG